MFTTLRKSVVVLAIAGVTVAAVAFDATAQGLLLRFTDTVRAYGTDEWTHFVEAGYHRLEVEGDRDTDLDCWIYDRNGNLIGSDTDRTDFCIIRWYQARGTRLDFRIENLGGVYNRYEFRLR
jgi:hypothetical protein